MSTVITMCKFNGSELMEKCRRLNYNERYSGTLYRVLLDDEGNVLKILDEAEVILVHEDNKVKNLITNYKINDQYYAKGNGFYVLVEGCKRTKKLEQQRNQRYLELQQQRTFNVNAHKLMQIQALLPNATEQQLNAILDILENN